MSNNSVSFGSTTIFHRGSNTPAYKFVNKLLKSKKFSEVKRINSLAEADTKLQAGQVGLLYDAKGITLAGQNAEEDKLIYDILTNHGTKRLPGSSYVSDHLDLTV